MTTPPNAGNFLANLKSKAAEEGVSTEPSTKVENNQRGLEEIQGALNALNPQGLTPSASIGMIGSSLASQIIEKPVHDSMSLPGYYSVNVSKVRVNGAVVKGKMNNGRFYWPLNSAEDVVAVLESYVKSGMVIKVSSED